MINRFRKSLYLCCLCGLSACGQTYDQLIIGKWSCNNGDTEGGKHIEKSDMEFIRNGATNQSSIIEINESGKKIEMSVVANGTWEINEAELITTTDNATIMSFSLNGQKMPVSTLPKQIKDSLIGVSSTFEITQLDSNALKAKKDANNAIYCTRE